MLDSRYILRGEPLGFDDEIDVECESSVNDDSLCFTLSRERTWHVLREKKAIDRAKLKE